MNKWFAGCDNVKLFELHKNMMHDLKRLQLRVILNDYTKFETVTHEISD